jgi:hypothetical protein
MKGWQVKALAIIDNIFKEEGPQTQEYLRDVLVRESHKRRGYKGISRSMGKGDLRELLRRNCDQVGTVKGKSTPVVLWGPRT